MSRKSTPPRSPSSRPFRSVASQMTYDDHVAVEESAAAELRGDWATAYERHRAVPMFAESQHGGDLRLMAELGESAPDWLRTRFVTSLVRRWEIYGQPRRATRVLREVIPMIHPHGVAFDAIGCEHPEQVTPYIWMCDWVVRQADVYDLGGLQDLMAMRSAQGAVATAPGVADWCRAPMGGWRIVGADGDVVVVSDAETGIDVELLDLGVTHQLEVGTFVLGRVVPTSTGPGRLFDWRPLPIDEETAVAVAREPRRWLKILAARAHWRLLPQAFSHLTDSSLSADLPRHGWGALAGHPIDELARIDRTLAAECLEVALSSATDPFTVRRQRHLVAELMLDEALDQRTVTRFARPSHRSGWQALASALPSHARGWCDEALWMIDAVTGEGLAG